MFVDGNYDFSNQQVLSGTSDVISTNVYDAGSAKKVFAGAAGRFKIAVVVDGVAANADNTIRARFVAADTADLATNADILADTGVSLANLGTAAGFAGGTNASPEVQRVFELALNNQPTARRYYGMIYTQGGTTPALKVNAQGVEAAQSNLMT